MSSRQQGVLQFVFVATFDTLNKTGLSTHDKHQGYRSSPSKCNTRGRQHMYFWVSGTKETQAVQQYVKKMLNYISFRKVI
jgi:hypothetical protein